MHTSKTPLSMVKDGWPLLQAFLNTQGVKDVLNKTSSPLAAITVLKKICVHPNLLSERATEAVAKGGETQTPLPLSPTFPLTPACTHNEHRGAHHCLAVQTAPSRCCLNTHQVLQLSERVATFSTSACCND